MFNKQSWIQNQNDNNRAGKELEIDHLCKTD